MLRFWKPRMVSCLSYIYIMLSMMLHTQHLAEHFEKALEQKQVSIQKKLMALQIKQLGGSVPKQPPIDKDTCRYCKQKGH